MITRGKAALVQMPALGGLLGEQANKPEFIKHNGFKGPEYAKRKSRSKIAKQSKKRNR